MGRSRPGPAGSARGPVSSSRAQLQNLFRFIERNDEAAVEAALRQLGRRSRLLAPISFALGALLLLVQGVRVLVENWRVALLQILPATWVWAAMLDLKLHLFRGKSFHDWLGWPVLLLVGVITLLTAVSFYLNVAFAFAVSAPGGPKIRPGLERARQHRSSTLALGVLIGLALGVATVVVPRWGRGWFAVSAGIAVGLLMVSYVALPCRFVGTTAHASRRDSLTASAVSGTVGAIVSAPGYLLGRVGVLLLGSKSLFVLGVILLVVGVGLHAGAHGAMKTITMSAKLLAGHGAPAEAPE